MIDYLKELYPDESAEMLKYYQDLIENYDTQKLPPTEAMREFAKLHGEVKKIEERMNELRSIILQQKERLGHNFQLLNISHIKGKKFSGSGFYNWVATLVDEKTLEEITVKTIDDKKFIKLEAKGVIQYDDIPKECYTDTEQWRISLARSNDETRP